MAAENNPPSSGLWKTHFHWSVLLRWDVLAWIIGILFSIGGILLFFDQYSGANVCFVFTALFVFAKIAQVASIATDPWWHRILFTFILFGLTGMAIVEAVRGVNRWAESKRSEQLPTDKTTSEIKESRQTQAIQTVTPPTSSPPPLADPHKGEEPGPISRSARAHGVQGPVMPPAVRLGTGPDAYKDLSDEQVGKWAIEEADKIEGMTDDYLARTEVAASRTPRPSIEMIRVVFEQDFKKCCSQDLIDLRTEVLRRLGPPAKDPKEENAWEEITPIGLAFNPMTLKYYAPYLRKLGIKLRRRAVPRQSARQLDFVETPVAPENSQFPNRLVATISTDTERSSGYVVVEFTSTPASIGTDFAGTLVLPSDLETISNCDLAAYLRERPFAYTIEIRNTPFTPAKPIRVVAADAKPFHFLKVTFFDE